MKDRLVRFNLFGQEFAFYSDAPDNEVELAIRLLRQELEGDEKLSRSAIPSSKMLVLGCLRLAAKYVQLEHEFQDFKKHQDQAIDQLSEKISGVMD